MPRRVEITVASGRTDELLTTLEGRAGIISLRVQRGIALQPPGDVLTLVVSNRALPDLYRTLREAGIGRDGSSVLTTDQTLSVMSAPSAPLIQGDTNDAVWEEMDARPGPRGISHGSGRST